MSKRKGYSLFERLCPLQLKLTKEPQTDLDNRLDDLKMLYAESSQRVHASLAEGDLSLVQARTRRRKKNLLKEIVASRLRREEFLREVRLMNVGSSLEKPWDYCEALDRYIETPIIVEKVGQLQHDRESVGSVSYDPVRNRIYIYLPQRLGWWNREYALAHECGHVAANHQFPVVDKRGNISDYQRPSCGLTRQPPIGSELQRSAILDLQDEEAELRARYTWLMCGLGQRALNIGHSKQLS